MSETDAFELFIPGRVCLFGEHSDWAGAACKCVECGSWFVVSILAFRHNPSAINPPRRTHPWIVPGETLVATLDQGLHARVTFLSERKVEVVSTPAAGPAQSTTLPLEASALASLAREGGYWSYVAGVLYLLAERWDLPHGLRIDNYATTLPAGAGLSSSAAVCVLVARAANRAFKLRLSARGEAALAFEGERATPSQCGRMDQVVALGPGPRLLRHAGDETQDASLALRCPLHLVLVGLGGKKDTVVILGDLQHAHAQACERIGEALDEEREDAWEGEGGEEGRIRARGKATSDDPEREPTSPPSPSSPTSPLGRQHRQTAELQAALVALLGRDNARLCRRAREAMEAGDAAALGALMTESQVAFDAVAGPLCPRQLGPRGSPLLGALLRDSRLEELVWGGKGVGSQGDGTAQLLCRSAEAQRAVVDLLRGEGKTCLTLTLLPQEGPGLA